MPLLVRTETSSDIAAIEALTVAAFLNAAHTSHTEHRIIAALREAGQLSISLVADECGAVVGHVAASPVTVSDGSAGWYGIGPVSVLPERQGEGIGSQLMERALAELRSLRAEGCVVLGDPAYYSRFGFCAVPSLDLPGVPPEYFLAMSFGGRLPSGSVAYHGAFDQV